MNKENIIPLGKIANSHGIKGEFVIKTFNTEDLALLKCKVWYVIDRTNTLLTLNISKSKVYKQGILAKCDEFNQPEEWKKFIGCEVGVTREEFPDIDNNEFYWVDLIGKEVVNLQNQKIGIVANMMDNGVQSILCIHDKENCSLADEILIPFTDMYVKEVKENIIVDWEIQE